MPEKTRQIEKKRNIGIELQLAFWVGQREIKDILKVKMSICTHIEQAPISFRFMVKKNRCI